MNSKNIYTLILLVLIIIHIGVWATKGDYSFQIFMAAFVGLAPTISIYQFLLGKTMWMGKFNLAVNQKGLRIFFFSFMVILFIIGYAASINVLPLT